VCDHILEVCERKQLVEMSPNLKLRCSWGQRWTD